MKDVAGTTFFFFFKVALPFNAEVLSWALPALVKMREKPRVLES